MFCVLWCGDQKQYEPKKTLHKNANHKINEFRGFGGGLFPAATANGTGTGTGSGSGSGSGGGGGGGYGYGATATGSGGSGSAASAYGHIGHSGSAVRGGGSGTATPIGASGGSGRAASPHASGSAALLAALAADSKLAASAAETYNFTLENMSHSNQNESAAAAMAAVASSEADTSATKSKHVIQSVELAMRQVQEDATLKRKEIQNLRQTNKLLEQKIEEYGLMLKKAHDDLKLKEVAMHESSERNEDLFRSLAAEHAAFAKLKDESRAAITDGVELRNQNIQLLAQHVRNWVGLAVPPPPTATGIAWHPNAGM